ncbi:Dehydrogenase [Lachnellula subtilissima]|uniref:Dehydrogenase n=1 Tax=Lachnellula subtilissima TaxID=602034 RepID=A0A8H8RVH3_9HELO|nr:Dehydrogenase [Lachnellula subtilissima]
MGNQNQGKSQNLAAVLEKPMARLTTVSRPIPTPGPDELVVRNYAVAANPVDWKIQHFGAVINKYPTVLGSDGCGVVTAVGSAISKFKIGDRVTGFAAVIYSNDLNHGAWQTYTVLREIATTKIPDRMTYEEGCVFPMAMATSAIALFVHLGIPRPTGQPTLQKSGLLIWGASSSVGVSALQLAKNLGFKVFVTASPTHHRYLRSLGAFDVFDYHDPAVVGKIAASARSAGTPIKLAFDAVTEGTSARQSADVLIAFGSAGSKLVLVLPWSENEPKPEGMEISMTVAGRTGTDQSELGAWFFNDYLQDSLKNGSIVPAPKIEIAGGGIAATQKVIDKLKAGAEEQPCPKIPPHQHKFSIQNSNSLKHDNLKQSNHHIYYLNMPLFALPLSTATKASTSARVHFTSRLPTRKRKRASSSSSEEEYAQQYSSGLPAASTNPLSLTPDEIAQYRLAGLDLNEEIPSVPGWPHRGLPGDKQWFTPDVKTKEKDGKGKLRAEDVEEEEEDNKAVPVQETNRGPKLRMQHLSVLTAVLQRCLLEGDILRARRAWALLIRAQVAGAGMDIRSSGYWGIGAELLIRSGESKARNRFHADGDSDYEADDEDNLNDRDRELNEEGWGSKDGLQRAKAYFERLILQYPYKRQFHGSVSALDFWPAMVSCEIYGIQHELKQSLKRIARAEEKDENEDGSDSDSDVFEDAESHVSEEDGDAATIEQRRTDKRSWRKAEKRWAQKDDARQNALLASESIAGRMDELMTSPPFSDSHTLLRLRGMLALYIGDLSVPAMPILEDEEGNDTDRRFLIRQRISDHERGKRSLDEEQSKARKLFKKVADSGDDYRDLNGLYLGDDQDEMELSYDD